MSKKHFIELADTVKAVERHYEPFLNDSYRGQTLRSVLDYYRDGLADFCKSQNYNFNRQRWLDYIAGECGPNGGAVKSKVVQP